MSSPNTVNKLFAIAFLCEPAPDSNLAKSMITSRAGIGEIFQVNSSHLK